jgi:hypothetical protein
MDYIYRVKAVVTQQRFDAIQHQLQNRQETSLQHDSAAGAGLKFLSAKPIETTLRQSAAVLSTQHSLPRRRVVEVTFLADRKYLTDEIQLQLEEISLAKVQSEEITQLQQRRRTVEWEIAAAEHLVDQLKPTDQDSGTFQVVSTNPVDSSTLHQDWKSALAGKQALYSEIVDQIRNASSRAAGFIAVAGKPQILPKVDRAMSISTVTAFFAGACTASLIFMLLRSSAGPAAAPGLTKKQIQRATKSTKSLSQESRPDVSSESGLRLADRIAKLGIPYLGAMDVPRISRLSGQYNSQKVLTGVLSSAAADATSIHELQHSSLGIASHNSQAPDRVGNQVLWSGSLQRSLEWLLILWMSAVAIRFFSDDIWRCLVLQSPLTGLAKLFSGIA